MEEFGVLVGDLFGQAVVGFDLWGQAEDEGRSAGQRKPGQRRQPKEAAQADLSGTDRSQSSDHPKMDLGTSKAPKRRGEVAEAAFLHKAARLGMAVAMPWGDSCAYDFIVESGGRLWRVQVKSASWRAKNSGYVIHAYGSNKTCAYSPKDVDVLVAYIPPEDAWYVFPICVFARVKSIKLYPNTRWLRSKFEEYREAWAMMQGG